MSLSTSTSAAVGHAGLPGTGSAVRRMSPAVHSPVPVLVSCLLGTAALVADGASGEADLGLGGVALMALALGLVFAQAGRARVGVPWRTSRLAAATGTAGSLFVAAFLASVGVLERMGPQVTSSPLFAAGVAGMSLILLIVLPLALVTFGWAVSRDRRLRSWLRVTPWALVSIIAATTVTAAVTDGAQELWSLAIAVGLASALLTHFSAGLCRAGSGRGIGAA